MNKQLASTKIYTNTLVSTKSENIRHKQLDWEKNVGKSVCCNAKVAIVNNGFGGGVTSYCTKCKKKYPETKNRIIEHTNDLKERLMLVLMNIFGYSNYIEGGKHYEISKPLLEFIESEKHSSYTQGVNETIKKAKEMDILRYEPLMEDWPNHDKNGNIIEPVRKKTINGALARNKLRKQFIQQLETLKEEK